jgi:hypothetical protein
VIRENVAPSMPTMRILGGLALGIIGSLGEFKMSRSRMAG